ncbi:MAG: amidohydrolase [Acidobacteria bacterium]|nr:amidohydrolase [Acidobacteriota bacterium]
MKRFLLLLVFAATFSTGLAAAEPADLVLLNARIYTVDPHLRLAQALAIREGRIIAVGASEEMQHWTGPETKVLDLDGKLVLPGFNDAHTHLAHAGAELLSVNLKDTRSLADFQQRIRARLPGYQPGEWITGSGWDQSLWPENRYPTRADLDPVSADHPMMFTRVDGHSAIVNSRALALAGITRDTADPEGGEIVRDAAGEPTGWLKESATALVARLIPAPTMEYRKRALAAALAEATRHGVTSVQDDSVRFGSWENFLAMRELKNEGTLTLRITEWLPFDLPVEKLKEMQREGGTDDPWLRLGALKYQIDGSGGSRTAAMLEPFSVEPGNRGMMFYQPEELKRLVIERDAAGFQMALHAIGDRAIRVTLDAFAAAREANGRRDSRHKIEHVQYVHRDDVPRFRELGVLASMQPCHLLAEIRWTSTLIGREREHEAYAVNSLLKAGAVVALGTDYPVENIPPLRNLYAATAREFEAGGPEGGWQPQEKINIEQALRSYTWGSAFAEFSEARKGTLTPGKFADLVVLSKDITRLPAKELLDTEVLLTMVGGRLVYEKTD